jgi:class 3 adenylate cyclase/pimeloyl-ACP methyl ester carboxylesterase
MEPQIRFCTSADGTRIAYATLGEGPPLVAVPAWGANMERDWKHPEGHAFLESLSRGRLFVAFDRRGVGASRGEVQDLSLEVQVADVSAVVDHLRLERFDLWGIVDGTAVSAAYAARHPDRVSRLVLWTAYPCGVESVGSGKARALMDLIRGNWSLARRAIADVTFPSGPTELQRWFSDSLREHASPEVTARCVEFLASVDVRPYLPQVKAPTLVLHRRGARDAPLEAGRAAAALVPDARFVALDGDMDHPFVGDISYLETMTQFLDEGRGRAPEAEPMAPGGLVTILFTDVEGSTGLTQRLGDAKAREVLRAHERIVREALKAHGGSEVKTMGDGFMASFSSATRALECAIAMQRAFAQHNESAEEPIRVRVGLNAGEPIAEEEDLFGTAVIRAARIAAIAQGGEILVANVVRELAEGKGFLFSDRGDAALRGFDDPVRLYEVRWRE